MLPGRARAPSRSEADGWPKRSEFSRQRSGVRARRRWCGADSVRAGRSEASSARVLSAERQRRRGSRRSGAYGSGWPKRSEFSRARKRSGVVTPARVGMRREARKNKKREAHHLYRKKQITRSGAKRSCFFSHKNGTSTECKINQ